ncbi:MAG TPA: hypothetical protein VF756_27005 [Thermoanaerobaculia bacterium]
MKFNLTDFPQAFLPLIVVVGDRREVRPKTSGDLLAYSASTLDLLYLPKLGLHPDTLILSDKVFVIERPEVIRQLCREVNILTIGSPAVNLFSRIINEYSVFRFDIEQEARDLMQKQYAIIENYKLDRVALAVYKAIVEQGATSTDDVIRYSSRNQRMPDERIDQLFPEIFQQVQYSGLENYRELLRKYEGRALLDPVKAGRVDLAHPKPRGEVISDYNDFGLVSIAKHPFADTDDKVVIYVAGRHGPGTAHGVASLARSKLWKGRELGGIFEVQINTFESYSQRIQSAARVWDMQPYSIGQFSLSALERSITKTRVFLSTPLRWADEENKEGIAWLAATITDILSKEFGDGHCHHPHEPDLAGQWNFVAGILKHFPGANLIVHNITGCTPGVMFEIGSSLGLGKKSVLFWDTSRLPFREDRLPSLLRFTPVVPIKLADRVAAANSLASLIPKAIRAEPSHGLRKDLTDTASDRQVFVFVKAKGQKLRREVLGQVVSREFIPKFPEEMIAENDLERVLEGVEQSHFVIVDVTDDDPDGMIILGLARARQRRTLELTRIGSRRCSMFDGLQKQWHADSLEDDMSQAIEELLRA